MTAKRSNLTITCISLLMLALAPALRAAVINIDFMKADATTWVPGATQGPTVGDLSSYMGYADSWNRFFPGTTTQLPYTLMNSDGTVSVAKLCVRQQLNAGGTSGPLGTTLTGDAAVFGTADAHTPPYDASKSYIGTSTLIHPLRFDIFGLDLTKTYDITIFASRSSTAGYEEVFTINKQSAKQTDPLMQQTIVYGNINGNTSEVINFTASPFHYTGFYVGVPTTINTDAITFEMAAIVGGTAINGLIIREVVPEPSGVSMVLLGGILLLKCPRPRKFLRK